MISSLVWVPKGAPRQHPVRFELSPEEYSRIKKLATEKDKKALGKTNEIDENIKPIDEDDAVNEEEGEVDIELPKELRMDEYDDEYEEANSDDNDMIDETEEFEMIEQGALALATDQEDLQDEDDIEDDEVKPSDSMIVVAITEDDFSHLEIQLYTEDGNLFVHHDINLPDFPLCLAWMDTPPFLVDGSQVMLGNYVAVGTFDPVIEIWNLDVLDPLEPTASLGGFLNATSAANYSASGNNTNTVNKKSKKGKSVVEYKPGSHEGAVMALSWNKLYRQAIASGSADNSVKIWDVTTQTCSHTFNHHSDKVQSVLWHPNDGWLLTTGSFDKTVCFLDCRTASSGVSGTSQSQSVPVAQYTLSDEVESFVWNPFDDNQLYCCLENGTIVILDRRNTSNPLTTFTAHSGAVTALAFSAVVPGMLATASVDKTVRVWDVNANSSATSSQPPHMVAYKSMSVGKLFALSFSPDDPFILAAGGDKGMLAIWESDELNAVSDYFHDRLPEKYKETLHTSYEPQQQQQQQPSQQQQHQSIITTTDSTGKSKNILNKNKNSTTNSTNTSTANKNNDVIAVPVNEKDKKKKNKKDEKSSKLENNNNSHHHNNNSNSNDNSNNTTNHSMEIDVSSSAAAAMTNEEDDSWMDSNTNNTGSIKKKKSDKKKHNK